MYVVDLCTEKLKRNTIFVKSDCHNIRVKIWSELYVEYYDALLTWIRIFIDCVWERLRVAPVGCRTLVGLPREELPVLFADEEVAEETEDTPAWVKLCSVLNIPLATDRTQLAICEIDYEPEMEDEPLAIEYKEAEAGTLPAPHLPPDTPAVTPVPMLYSDALWGSTQDLPDIEYYKPKQLHSA